MAKKTQRKAARAAPLPRIGRKGPPVGDVMPALSASSRLVEYLALEGDPAAWFRIMQAADVGDTCQMIDTFGDSRDRDAHLDGVTRKRAQSMMGRPIAFPPAQGFEDDKEAQQIAKLTRRILLAESRDFRSMLAHLMTGAPYGFAVAKLRWTTNATSEYVPHLDANGAHCNRFAFTRDTREIGFYAGTYRSHLNVKKLADYPDAFVAHVPMGGRSDYPWRRGAMRSCIIPSFIKRAGLRWWMRLCERFGMPQPYATIPQGIDHDGESDDDTAAVILASLKNLSTNWAAVFSEGVEIDSIPGSGNVNAEVHKGLIEWGNTTQSISMLGQNLTTEVQGGSFAAAESHRYVAGDLHLADATELASTITQQIVEPLVRYNWPGAPVPVCEIGTGAKQVPTEKDVEMGIFSDDERRRMLGHEAKADGSGAEYRRPVLVAVPDQIAAPTEDVEAGDVVDTEAPTEDTAVAKDPAASLNGAQPPRCKGS
jgi:phage gp29-like protein